MDNSVSLGQGTLALGKRESAWKFQRISSNIYMSESGIYETSKEEVEPDALLRNGQTASRPWARWGKDNNYAQRLINTVMADPAAVLLEKRASMHWGAGIMFYNKKVDDKGNERIEMMPDEKVPAEIMDFLWLNDWPNFMQGIIADFEWWHRYYVQYITNLNGKVMAVKWQRCKDVRPAIRNPETGNIDKYYLSGKWPDPVIGVDVAEVPAFNRLSLAPASGLYAHHLVSIDKDYFPQPAWHGISRWLSIAGKIPRWILANIDNSINIKYHVKIPLDYFLKRHPIEAYRTSDERNEAIQKDEKETMQRIDQYLSGERNVGKAFYSKVAIDDRGNALPGWEIIPLENKINDTAWLNAYGTASMAIASGMSLSPSLSGQVLPNGLGAGSGSDLREQFNFYMQVMTAQPRQTTLEPWEIIKRLNKWPRELHMGYRQVILQSTDQNKSGFNQQNEQSPTTSNTNRNQNQPV